MTIERYTNKFGKECYKGVKEDTHFKDLEFHEITHTCAEHDEPDVEFVLHTNLGSLTVLNRMTGFGCRDTETGYRDPDGTFWLASGGYDVRVDSLGTIEEAIGWVKDHANTCVGYRRIR